MKKKTRILVILAIISLLVVIPLVPLNILTETVLDTKLELSKLDDDRETLEFGKIKGGYHLNIVITFESDLATRVSLCGLDRTACKVLYIIKSENEGLYNISKTYLVPIEAFHIRLSEGGNISVAISIEKKPIIIDIALGALSGVILLAGLLVFISIPQRIGKFLHKIWMRYFSHIVTNFKEKNKKTKQRKQQKLEEIEAKRLQEEQTKEGLASGRLRSCPNCQTVVQIEDENCSSCNLRIDQFEIYKKKRR